MKNEYNLNLAEKITLRYRKKSPFYDIVDYKHHKTWYNSILDFIFGPGRKDGLYIEDIFDILHDIDLFKEDNPHLIVDLETHIVWDKPLVEIRFSSGKVEFWRFKTDNEAKEFFDQLKSKAHNENTNFVEL